ncbi:hypothetical protein GLOIN_2v1605194 [Rhizophagus clarus]|uniref:PH domain-containing protein n=1 Tax=Rhizophagus clarus TaxID=94130 RepID=A0A8H3LQR2_9GLOM|nr:hypothetical protein GLOIN_2v1605194 [Rhizophagus clarus]
MLTNTKTNIEKNEIIIIDASNRSQDKLSNAILEERVKAAAKLEGVSTDKILARNKKATTTSNNTRNIADRLSKESGIGSSVGSSFDENDEMDHLYNEQFTSSSSQSTVSTDNAKLSPILSQSLDDLDDMMTKLPNDNKKSLGIITEEDEKYHQNRITFSDSNSEVTESSTFNDTESSISGGDPDSPSLLNNISIVLSSSSLRSSSSSSLQRGSLSDPEDTLPNHHQRVNTPGSPSKPDRILVRSGFGSLTLKRRRSKPALSLALSDNNSNNKMMTTGLSSSRPGSPENSENLSKAGKILGLTISEEKILLDNKLSKKSRDTKMTTGASDEKISPTRSFNKNNSSKANKLLGYNDNNPMLSRQSKASKVLGIDDNELNRRSPSMYMDRGSIESQMTVASIRKNVIYKGFLAKHTNTHFKSWKSWKRRFFILAKNTLYCFKSSDLNSPLLDQFELTSDSVVCVSDAFNGKSWVLQVSKSNHSNQKSWYIQADNVDDMKVWLTELKSTVVKCNHTPETPNSADRLLYDDDDDDDDDDYDFDDDLLNDDKIHQRTFSSPSKFTNSPESSLIKSSSSIDDYSLPPPPRPQIMASLPPPPRPRSAPSSPSCPPSPITSLSPPPRQMSPLNHIPSDVEELCSIDNDVLEIPRSASPVETLSPPRARFCNSIHEHKGSISSTCSTSSVTSPSRNKYRSNSANSLSINTTLTSIQKPSSPRQSPLSSPSVNNSPRKSARSSTSSYRESIPIMMPSGSLIAPSPTFISDNPTLSPLSRTLSLRNVQQMSYKSSDFYARLPNPPKPPEGPKPPARNNVKVSLVNSDLYLSRNPPPNIPLPQPPPRPANTLTSASRVTSRTSLHPPPPIPPPRRPSADGRMGGKGTNSIITNFPVPVQNNKQATSSSRERFSHYERNMTLPINLPSRSSYTRLPARSKSPPPSRNNTTSMIYSSNPSRFQTMSINLPSHFTIAPLPPPTRPPNIPLPPVPTQSSNISMITPLITKNFIDNIQDTTLPPELTSPPPIEFPDDDDLDPDYAEELAASRIRSQKLKNTTPDTYLSVGNSSQQLPTSGLTFVMVEETLGDGELVLDLQDVSEDHPHVIRSKSSRNNIHNDLIRNDKEEKNMNKKNITILEEMNSEGNEKENIKEEEKETVKEVEDRSIKENLGKNDIINNVNGHVKNVINKNNINNVPSSNLSI